MRIAILTQGRFHVLDLARELAALGHQVMFYSLVPPWKTREYGLPESCNRWLGAHLAAAYPVACRLRGRLGRAVRRGLVQAFERLAARSIEHCDLLIAMSGMAGEAAREVKRRYDARVIIERGSRHIFSQREILNLLPGNADGSAIASWEIDRELADYELADVVCIPSLHVERSFVEHGFSRQRLFRNPYGVSLSMFPATPMPQSIPATILMTGTWSYRKGCDVLVDACSRLSAIRLVHVGTVLDMPLPHQPWFEHHDWVPQSELKGFYARAHVFALASREEGLAVVQAQALASGLRLVCTDRTGGEDLAELTGMHDRVSVVPHDHPQALAHALAQALERSTREGERTLPENALGSLSWSAYGQRYHRFITGNRLGLAGAAES